MAKIKCPQCAHLNDDGATLCSRCKTSLPKVAFDSGTTPKRGTAPPGDGVSFRRGQVVANRYTVLDLVGRGGMGCIYRARDNVLGEDVALKALLPRFVAEKIVVDRFLNEARITRKLAHPNIVRVHDIGVAGKGLFISMEYVQGDSLRGLLRKQRPGERIPVRQALRIIDELCGALEYAHKYTIHRDIKPENIMITEDNHIKLMDFGVSKLMADHSATSASLVMGTPYYMAPEQQRSSRDVDARADIYSIGVVLYELLTGNTPSGVPRTASEITHGVPPALDAIVARCVAPDREARFGSVEELRAAIQPIISMLDDGTTLDQILSVQTHRRIAFPVDKRHVLAALILLLVIGGIGAGLWAVERWGDNAIIGAASPLPQAHVIRFGELRSMILMAREQALALETPTESQRQWLDAAAARWLAAEEKARQGAATAVLAAEETLQHYLAVFLAPENMVFVPPGYVTVDGEEIYVPGFFIDRYEVTLARFAAFCESVEDSWPMPSDLGDAAAHYPDRPVTHVSWFDAQAYAAWQGKTLPTRAQWARAAYGDTEVPDTFPWGDEPASGKANIQGDRTRSIGSFPDDMVWSGCQDMAGNVMEWTRTRADETDAPPDFGDILFVCGGSFQHTQPLREATTRTFETRAPDLGFRCVRELDTTPEAVAAVAP